MSKLKTIFKNDKITLNKKDWKKIEAMLIYMEENMIDWQYKLDALEVFLKAKLAVLNYQTEHKWLICRAKMLTTRLLKLKKQQSKHYTEHGLEELSRQKLAKSIEESDAITEELYDLYSKGGQHV